MDDGDDMSQDQGSDTDAKQGGSLHPRIRERRAEVEDQSQRSRKRKLTVFAVVVAALLLAAASTQSALFDVDEVRIVGASRTSPDVLRDIAGVELGTALLGLDTDAAEQRLLELPEVRTATVTSTWNGVVTAEINERLPVARIESANGTIVVAEDGIVIEIVERVLIDAPTPDAEIVPDTPRELEPLPVEIERLPEIAGAMFVIDQGDQIPDVLTNALAVAAALPADIAIVTERVEITVDSLVLRLVGGGQISLGDARDLDMKFDAVRAFLDQVDLSCLDTLNVRAPSVPVIRRNSNC